MSEYRFKKRRYRHFDAQAKPDFVERIQNNPDEVARHCFSPLIYLEKVIKRYKKCPESSDRKIAEKKRPIMYASHRDACIYAWYAHQLNEKLERRYERDGTGDCVIAYRALGKANYDAAAEALAFARTNAPVTILAFDVSSFFDTLDHSRLKHRLKEVLEVEDLSPDWLKVLKSVTRFRFVKWEELSKHSKFGPRLKNRSRKHIATVAELKVQGMRFHPNPELEKGRRRGIPQGTPLSAVLSNLYMVDFDAEAKAYCERIGALYRRYSDDILVICEPEYAKAVMGWIVDRISQECLEIHPGKTEETLFGADSDPASQGGSAAQYLGFTLRESGATIREATLARQWRKMRRAIRREKRLALERRARGDTSPVRTKKLRRRFLPTRLPHGDSSREARNFSAYVRRSAEAFKGESGRAKIGRQVKRLERAVEKELRELKNL